MHDYQIGNDGSLQHLDTVPAEAFNAKFEEGGDYRIVEDGNYDFVLEGLNDAGETTTLTRVIRLQ